MIVYKRDIAPLGYIEVPVEPSVGYPIKNMMGVKKVKHKANQEQMEMGWLLL